MTITRIVLLPALATLLIVGCAKKAVQPAAQSTAPTAKSQAAPAPGEQAVSMVPGDVTAAGNSVSDAAPPVSSPVAAQIPADESDQPQERPEPKSRLVKALLQVLEDNPSEGTREERKLVRRVLLEADHELDQHSGQNLRDKILSANNKPAHFRVGANLSAHKNRAYKDKPQGETKLGDAAKDQPSTNESKPPAPQTDVDDPFGFGTPNP